MTHATDHDQGQADGAKKKESFLYQLLVRRRLSNEAVRQSVAVLVLSFGIAVVAQLGPASWYKLVEDAVQLALGLMLLTALVLVVFVARNRTQQLKRPYRFAFGLAALSSITVSTLWTFVPSALKSLATAALTAPTTVQGALLASVGAALFLFRLKCRSVYGITEAGFGLKIGLDRIAAVPSAGLRLDQGTKELALGVLTASVYLIVRGLDNVHQGTVAAKPDPVFRWALRLLLGAPNEKHSTDPPLKDRDVAARPDVDAADEEKPRPAR